jgi:hypothetical protein
MDTGTEHTHCHRCGRTLRSAISCVRKYGSGCWAIVRRAARALNDRLAVFTRRQLDQAVELIEDAAVVPAAIADAFHIVSTDGQEVYTTTRETCDCPASRECYHQLAVLLVSA